MKLSKTIENYFNENQENANDNSNILKSKLDRMINRIYEYNNIELKKYNEDDKKYLRYILVNSILIVILSIFNNEDIEQILTPYIILFLIYILDNVISEENISANSFIYLAIIYIYFYNIEIDFSENIILIVPLLYLINHETTNYYISNIPYNIISNRNDFNINYKDYIDESNVYLYYLVGYILVFSYSNNLPINKIINTLSFVSIKSNDLWSLIITSLLVGAYYYRNFYIIDNNTIRSTGNESGNVEDRTESNDSNLNIQKISNVLKSLLLFLTILLSYYDRKVSLPIFTIILITYNLINNKNISYNLNTTIYVLLAIILTPYMGTIFDSKRKNMYIGWININNIFTNTLFIILLVILIYRKIIINGINYIKNQVSQDEDIEDEDIENEGKNNNFIYNCIVALVFLNYKLKPFKNIYELDFNWDDKFEPKKSFVTIFIVLLIAILNTIYNIVPLTITLILVLPIIYGVLEIIKYLEIKSPIITVSLIAIVLIVTRVLNFIQ